MQVQVREAVYWLVKDADITDYVHWCTICTKHKASPPSQPMLPRDIPDGPWQESTANYLAHKGRQYLLVCNLFSKYPFLYKVSTNSAQSLCMHLQELISQYRLPCLLYTDNGPPFMSKELMQFLQCNHKDHVTSSASLSRSNRFIEWQVRTLKTTLNTAQDSMKTIKDLLLDLWSTPIRPSMPSPGRSCTTEPYSNPVSLLLQLTWRGYGTSSSPWSSHKRHTLTSHMVPKS